MRHVPAAADSDGGLACDLSAGYGLVPFVWQRSSVTDVMAVRADGKWAASRAGLSVPRQNGKNADAEIFELWVTSQLAMRVLHSAHEVKTARKAFKRLLGFYDNPRQYPELHELVKDIRRTNGQEAVELHNGGSVEFTARTRSAGRGFTEDILLLDEAQELTDDELEAVLPAISTSANPMTFLMGTPPKPEQPAVVWRRYRKAAIEGTDDRLCWIEYGAEIDDDLDAIETWAKANPGAPESISWDSIADERAQMSDEGFARERLGIWQPETSGPAAVIPDADWDACHKMGEPAGRKHLALDVSPSQADAAISVAGYGVDGFIHIQVAHSARGTHWVVDRLVAAHADTGSPIGIVKGSAAEALRDDLDKAGVPVLEISQTDYATACGELLADVTSPERKVRHRGQEALDEAVRGATTKGFGERWVFDRRKSNANITPLCASAVAARMARTEQADAALENFW